MQIPEGSIPFDSEEYKIIETANINNYIRRFPMGQKRMGENV